MKKFYYSKDEMLRDSQSESEKILGDYNSTVKEIKKYHKKVILIIIICIIIFKFIVGTIEINSPLDYSKNRLYKVTVNKTPVTVQVIDHYRTFIIPFFLYFNAYYKNTYPGMDTDSIYYIVPDKTQYLLDIESYSCYSKNNERQVECQIEDNFHQKKNNDTTYTNLYIRRNGRPETEMYDGKFINNITSYIQQKGVYYIRIDAKYGNVTSKIEFFLKQK